MDQFEIKFVDWLSGRSRAGSAVELGIGDDMAILRTPTGRILVASDMLLDGVHFDTAHHDLSLIGRKAVACNLSDCAAMAVRPLSATVSVAWPRNRPLEDAKRLYEGIETIAAEYDLAIAGGDTTSWEHPLAIDVAISAVPYEGIEPVLRSGAQVGDRLYVTGPLGGSLAGKHLTFGPRVREAYAVAGSLGSRLHAMIDVSDGLALDLHRLCAASGVGATLEEEMLERVISPAAREASPTSGRSALQHALADGEDFELLLAIEGEAEVEGVDLLPVGRITDGPLTLRQADGDTMPLEPTGYVH